MSKEGVGAGGAFYRYTSAPFFKDYSNLLNNRLIQRPV